ncbi:MAG: 3-hydroxyacyl-CoA dehydrogenase/enoyl-CoA hydratase family protein [Alphaproteobacteria bacterium]|nr:3-hydroxyacyl-CoA dehydrogenase/enoyl-CoA hydratase family protein [Alphaproteobacteria bacterium]
MTISKVAVIGSGVMGSGIAAQIANAGLDVVLLDIVPKDAGDDRSKIAKGAIEKMLKADPAPFMHPRNAKRITAGNLEDDLKLLGECDWIIEVVLEDLAVKHATYDKIEKNRKKGSIVSSNTSTIPLAKLVEGHGKQFEKDFLITHFFNPPRYMRLLEIVIGPNTRKDAVAEVVKFCDIKLGKGVVECKDTPGFIVNRILTFWMQAGVNAAIDMNVPIEVVDAIMSKPVGIPKTGIFGLIDLVGVDLMPHLSKSLLSTLPDGDEYRKIYRDIPLVGQMIAAGYNGRKGKGGFYRLDAKRTKMAIQLNTPSFDENASYKPADKPKLESADAGKKGLRGVVEHPDMGGRYAWVTLSQTLAYAASLVPAIANDVAAVDEAMRLGCNWKMGPFEMIDSMGPKWFADKLRAEGKPVPAILDKVGEGTFYKVEAGKLHFFGTDGKYHPVVRAEGVLLLADIKRAKKPLIKNASASVWDVGDGVLCLEFTSKMNAIDDQIFAAIHGACDLIDGADGTYKALVVYNEGSTFSAGANLGLALFAINIALWPQIEELVSGGQEAYKRLKYSAFPVVAAPSGLALGGGCEILLASDHVQAHAELYCGLVEVGVGVIPGWGGCKELLQRYGKASQAKGPIPAVKMAFETIGTAKVAKSADDAKDIGYLKASDGITMNRDRLLFDAKQKALELAANYNTPIPQEIRLPGPSGKYALELAVADLRKSGKATPYDVVVCDALAEVLTGGPDADPTKPVTEDRILELEREGFMKLIRNEGTMARIEHMLDKGKPLRN